jgi:tetratricopeptide (TPR) repeat protein
MTRSHVAFHVSFGLLSAIELCAFIFFFSFWMHSYAVAFLIGIFLLTGFSYFVLFAYLQTRKRQQLIDLGELFIEACERSIPPDDGFALSSLIYQIIDDLDSLISNYYALPIFGETINTLLRKFSVYCHWQDILLLKHLLLTHTISSYLRMVKRAPMDLGLHAALAEAYLSLASLYQEPANPLPWTPPDYGTPTMQAKHKNACLRALEEYTIIAASIPQDPWIHIQLATVHRKLGNLDKEISEYEYLLTLSPEHRSVMFHLGVLYFQQGSTAKGLQLYETLKNLNDADAENLIAYYIYPSELLPNRQFA